MSVSTPPAASGARVREALSPRSLLDRARYSENLWTYVPLIVAILGLSIYASANSDLYLTSDNIEVLLNSVTVLGLITVGMTLIMVAGQLDLSVGALATLASV